MLGSCLLLLYLGDKITKIRSNGTFNCLYLEGYLNDTIPADFEMKGSLVLLVFFVSLDIGNCVTQRTFSDHQVDTNLC